MGDAQTTGNNERYYITDTALSERFPLYTRANVGEVFPDPVTPLTSSTAMWFAELGWRDAWERMGAFSQDEFPADEFCQLGVVAGYCYLNASAIRLFGERAPGLSAQDMDDQFFGALPGIPPYEPVEGDTDLAKTQKIGETFGWVLGQSSLDQLEALTADREMTRQLRADRPDLTTIDSLALWDRYQELVAVHRKLFSEHIFTTYMATVPVGIITGVATAVGRPDLVMPIIAGIGDVDSAEPSHAMWAMGRMVAASPALTEAFDAGVPGLVERLAAIDDPAAAEFAEAMDSFAYEFGSRGPNEWESRSPSWETHPELVLASVERLRLAPADADPAAQHAVRAAARAEAAAELAAMVEGDPETHGQLQAGIAATGAWLPGRERTKTNNIRLVQEMRMLMRELGRRVVAVGGFDEVEDFGFVTAEEFPGFLAGLDADPTAMLAAVRSRREEYNGLLEREAQFLFNGQADPPDTWRLRADDSTPQLVVDESIQGIPGCSGSATGRARVVLDSFDPSALEPGDILVAPITDPSWTPLFMPAAAVVVDVGAPLSHAIIVSRELGIPCVVSATDATRRIPDGATIHVDGGTGAVTVIEL